MKPTYTEYDLTHAAIQSNIIDSIDDAVLPDAINNGAISLYKTQFGDYLVEALNLPACMRTADLDFMILPDPNHQERNFERMACLFSLCYVRAANPMDSINDKLYLPLMAFAETVVPLNIQLKGHRDTVASRNMITTRMKATLLDANGALKPAYAPFYAARTPGGPDQRDLTIQHLDGHVAWMSANDADTIDWDNDLLRIVDRMIAMDKATILSDLMKALVEFVFTISVRGTCSEQKLNKYREAVARDNRVTISLSTRDVADLWRTAEKVIKDNAIPIERVMSVLASLFPIEISLRVHMTIQQAVFSGGSTITIITSAMASHPSHPVWKYLLQNANAEMLTYSQIARTLATNKLGGYGGRAVTERIKGTTVPNLFYAAIMLKVEMQGDQSVRGYARKVTPSLKAEIDSLIKKYKDQVAQGLDPEDWKFDEDSSLTSVMTDLSHIASTFNSQLLKKDEEN